jgi:molybdate transport system substrate-binding protein
MVNRCGWLTALALALVAVVGACDRRGSGGSSSGTPAPAPVATREVRIAAAASLKPALEEIISAFSATHAGVKVTATYGASGNFYGQLVNKAPFDVFMSADTGYPHRLVEGGQAAPGSEKVFARGVLVLWVPKASTLDIDGKSVAALRDPSVKHISIANPKNAPYGRAAEAAMKSAGIYDAAKDRLVQGENVEQAAQFAQTGAAEAALLPLSLARAPAMKDAGRFVLVDSATYPPIEHGMIITAWAGSPADAAAFCDYVMGTGGREVLARHGFGAPPPAPPPPGE